MRILDRKTYKQMEWYLYNYHEIKREVQEEKDDIINSCDRDYT